MEIRCIRRAKKQSGALLRLGIAALAALVLASAPHVDAQRREAAPRTTASGSTVEEQVAGVEGVVNIQTATIEELQRLPGIGPSKAAAIVAFRERTPFRRVEDILRVRGIGRATFRRLRPMLTVSGPTTLRQDVRAARPRVVDFEVDEDEHAQR